MKVEADLITDMVRGFALCSIVDERSALGNRLLNPNSTGFVSRQLSSPSLQDIHTFFLQSSEWPCTIIYCTFLRAVR